LAIFTAKSLEFGFINHLAKTFLFGFVGHILAFLDWFGNFKGLELKIGLFVAFDHI